MGFTVSVKELLPALSNVKRGTLRDPFPGEEPDFVAEHDKLCTGMTFVDNGFSVEFNPSIQLVAGCGYVFEEQ